MSVSVVKTAFKNLVIKGRSLLPIVQGGMGVGVSAHRLAGTVASLGACGTISSVDLRRHHPDLMARTGRSRDRALIDAANPSKRSIARSARRSRSRTAAGSSPST